MKSVKRAKNLQARGSAHFSESAIKNPFSGLKICANYTEVLVHVLIKKGIDIKILAFLKHR